MAEKVYSLGARPRIRGTFTDEDGGAFTPTTTLLTVRKPGGTKTPYTDSTIASNVAEKKLPATDEAGRWTYRFEGDDGTHFAVNEGAFVVHDSEVL